jgi:hypothetical protein
MSKSIFQVTNINYPTSSSEKIDEDKPRGRGRGRKDIPEIAIGANAN